MPKKIDNTGLRFGRLVAISDAGKGRWIFQCDCGAIVNKSAHSVRAGDTRSCGCLHREIFRAARTKHGASSRAGKSPEYVAWLKAKRRCHVPEDKSYGDYGARGIEVCDEWRNSFEAFFAEVGPKPTPAHSIDRIDVNKGYCPGNVRWATRKVQSLNRQNTLRVEYGGVVMTMKEWCESLKVDYYSIHGRMKRNNQSFETAVGLYKTMHGHTD